METCYVPIILNVLIDSFFLFARYQVYFKSIFPAIESFCFLCGKLKMRGQYHVDKRQDIFCDNLPVAEKAREERSYLKPRFYLHLYVDKSQEMQTAQGKNNGQDIQFSCRSA